MPRKTNLERTTKRQRQRAGRKLESQNGKSAYAKQRRSSYSL